MTGPEVNRIRPAVHSVGLAPIWQQGESLTRLSKSGMFWHQVRQAFVSFHASPLLSVVSVLTIAMVLLVFGSFILFAQNFSEIVSGTQSRLVLRVFLRDDAKVDETSLLKRELESLERVRSVVFKDKNTALSEFRAALGEQADLLDGLEGQNPLPASFELQFAEGQDLDQIFESVAQKYKAHPAVDQVRYSSGVLWQLKSFMYVLSVLAVFGILLMVLMASFIISSTIRLVLYSRREELEIMGLVGATNSFVKAPCLIEGMVQGGLGALVALVVLYPGWRMLLGFLGSTDSFALIEHNMAFLSVTGMILVVLFGLFVGFLGSFFAVKPFLAK